MDEKNECCCHKTKERSEKEYKDLINRLSRIEGQIRGIKRMVEEDAYCPDILIQVSAANAALNSFNKVLLSNHIRTCVADDIRAGKDETINELVNTLQKLMKWLNNGFTTTRGEKVWNNIILQEWVVLPAVPE